MSKTPPNDINAEAAVLCAMLIDPKTAVEGIDKLTEKHFYKPAHGYIFRAVRDLFIKNSQIDLITVIDNLQVNKLLDKAGGKAYVAEITDFVSNSSNFEDHLRIIIEKARLRNMISTCNEIIKASYDQDEDLEKVIDFAERSFFEMNVDPFDKGFIPAQSLAYDTLKHIEEIAERKKSVLGLDTGFPDLDRMVGGFRPGQLIVIAARPAMGKTSLALNIATHSALEKKKKVGIFTMEMSSEELLIRIFSNLSEVNLEYLIKGFGMDNKKISRLTQVVSRLESSQLYIDDSGTNTSVDLKTKIRKLAIELDGLDLILIDYLQLMSSSRSKSENRQQEIAEISRALKIIAREMNIPVVALSQLNRSLESRDDRRPRLSDLRESGAIEQDSDLVMFIYRDEYYNPDTSEPGVSEVIIGKNRHGPTGVVKLMFIKEITGFKSYFPDPSKKETGNAAPEKARKTKKLKND